MIVFFSGGTGIPWQVSVGLIVLSSIIGTPFFGGGFDGYNYFLGGEQVVGAPRGENQVEVEEGLGWMQIICLAVAILSGYFICLFSLQVSRHAQAFGFRTTMRRLWQTPIRQWHTFLAPQRRGAPPQGNRQPTTTHAERLENVSSKIGGLPVEQYVSKEDLQAMPLHDLKLQMLKKGLTLRPGEAIDRNEAQKLLLDIGGSSSESCMICCEDYKSQDTLRRLPKCKHCFHLECVDRWLLSTAEYSNRTASCPMCNTAL